MELRESGETNVVERITAEVKAGNCACEVRNPGGKCCLGEVERAVNEMQQRLAATGELRGANDLEEGEATRREKLKKNLDSGVGSRV